MLPNQILDTEGSVARTNFNVPSDPKPTSDPHNPNFNADLSEISSISRNEDSFFLKKTKHKKSGDLDPDEEKSVDGSDPNMSMSGLIPRKLNFLEDEKVHDLPANVKKKIAIESDRNIDNIDAHVPVVTETPNFGAGSLKSRDFMSKRIKSVTKADLDKMKDKINLSDEERKEPRQEDSQVHNFGSLGQMIKEESSPDQKGTDEMNDSIDSEKKENDDVTKTIDVESPQKDQAGDQTNQTIGEKQCRICLDAEETKETGKMIRPCKCDGSMKYVHEECLKTWIISKGLDLDKVKCEVCSTLFLMNFTYGTKFYPRVACEEGLMSFLSCICLTGMIGGLILIIIVIVNSWGSSPTDSSNTNNEANNSNSSGSSPQNSFSFKLAIVVACSVISGILCVLVFVAIKEAFFILEIKEWEITNFDPSKTRKKVPRNRRIVLPSGSRSALGASPSQDNVSIMSHQEQMARSGSQPQTGLVNRLERAEGPERSVSHPILRGIQHRNAEHRNGEGSLEDPGVHLDSQFHLHAEVESIGKEGEDEPVRKMKKEYSLPKLERKATFEEKKSQELSIAPSFTPRLHGEENKSSSEIERSKDRSQEKGKYVTKSDSGLNLSEPVRLTVARKSAVKEQRDRYGEGKVDMAKVIASP